VGSNIFDMELLQLRVCWGDGVVMLGVVCGC
jgi:hypothetical protein